MLPATGIVTARAEVAASPLSFLAQAGGLPAEQQAKLTAAEGTDEDYFGDAVAVSGDTAVVTADWDDVGSSRNQGTAYVFVRSGTVWTRQATLNAADGAASMCFGSSAAVSGDTIAIGAIYGPVGSNVEQGAVYIFTRTGSVWTQQAKLVASDGDEYDWFGSSVALSGETLVVGALGDDVGGNTDQGSAYVFTRSATIWSQQQKITRIDGAGGDLFGCSVAVSDDTALVGARRDDVGASADEGSASVFTRSGDTWDLQQTMTASDGAAEDWFGHSVALAGDTAVVGAIIDDVGSSTDQGSACVFVRSGSVWSQQQKLTALQGGVDDQFGCSVAIATGVVVVGDRYDDVGAFTHMGSARVFMRDGGVWTQEAELTASDGASSDSLGSSVACSGGTVVAGAPNDGPSSRGSACVFVGLSPGAAPPVTTDDTDGEWHRSPLTVTFSAVDPEGEGTTTHYRVDNGPWQTGTSATFVTRRHKTWSEHAYLITYYSVDESGNPEVPKTCYARLDCSGPETTDDAPLGWVGEDTTVHFTATDAGSGWMETHYSLDGGPWSSASWVTVPAPLDGSNDGVHSILYRSVDCIGNVGPDRRCEFRVGVRALPLGLVVYASGNIDSNGGGNNPKVTIEGTPSTSVTAIAGGTILAPEAIDTRITEWDSSDDPPPPPLDAYISPEAMASIEQLAVEKGRYFASIETALSSPPSPDSPTGGLSGLCVIRTTQALDLTGNDVLNSVEQPGLLVLLGGGGSYVSGTTQFCGFLFTDGEFRTGIGMPRIEGMLVTAGDFVFTGTSEVAYNEACIRNIPWVRTKLVTPDPGPSAPSGVEATPGFGRVHLTWDTSTSGDVVRYSVWRSVDGGAWMQLTEDVPIAAYTDGDGIESGRTYAYRVYAISASDRWSAPSAVVSASGMSDDLTAPPAPVLSGTYTQAGKAVTIYWTQVSDSPAPTGQTQSGTKGYRVYRSTSATFPWDTGLIWDSNGLIGAYDDGDTSKSYGVTYYYWVCAYDNALNLSSPSNVLTVPMGAVPIANLTVRNASVNKAATVYVFCTDDLQWYTETGTAQATRPTGVSIAKQNGTKTWSLPAYQNYVVYYLYVGLPERNDRGAYLDVDKTIIITS